MEAYELEPDKILNWCAEYASFEQLEKTAKSVYSIYISRRKKEEPEKHTQAKQYRKKYNARRLKK